MRSRSPLLLVLAFMACSHATSSTRVVADPVLSYRDEPRELAVDQQVKHALDRLTYGPRPGEAAAVLKEGLDNWLIRQLTPENYPDAPVDSLIMATPALLLPVKTLVDSNPPQFVFVRRKRAELGLAANAPYTMTAADSAEFKVIQAANNRQVQQILGAKFTRSVISDRQLLEVVTDFWENHFSVFRGNVPTQYSLLEYDRDVIRPHALGKFRDLLGAVAHSPEMLYYLNNYQSSVDSAHLSLPQWTNMSRARTVVDSERIRSNAARRRAGLNENYGRELLELHTLGVDGGYTQADVINVARALTGWTMQNPVEGGGFYFNPNTHDAEVKVVLGHVLAPGRGEQDGEDVLDIIAHHPSTAHYIALKLIRHFVADTAPPALVARAADVFTRTDGDIRQVLATIVSSPEFYTKASMRSKVKTPYELLASTYRVMMARPDSGQRSIGQLPALGQPIFGRQTPDGWPDNQESWMNTGSVLARINFGNGVAAGRIPNIQVARWPVAISLRGASLEEQVSGIESAIFQGELSPDTHRVLLSGSNPLAVREGAAAAMMRAPTLAELIGLALGAPEFQRR